MLHGTFHWVGQSPAVDRGTPRKLLVASACSTSARRQTPDSPISWQSESMSPCEAARTNGCSSMIAFGASVKGINEPITTW